MAKINAIEARRTVAALSQALEYYGVITDISEPNARGWQEVSFDDGSVVRVTSVHELAAVLISADAAFRLARRSLGYYDNEEEVLDLAV